MTPRVVIVDYGLGNLRSVAGAVEKLGFEAHVTASAGDILAAERLILPGVGAFGDGMRQLHERGLAEPLTRRVIDEGVPILGICLGAQLMARESEEFGHHSGLGWLPASVKRIVPPADSVRIPHVGWNALRQRRPDLLFAKIPEDALFYYVHSYHICCDDPAAVTGTCDYAGTLTATFQRGNVWGTQFHPEKSQRHGLQLLANFVRA